MIDTTILVYDVEKFDEAAQRYVDEGTEILKAERQADVDGTRRFLKSEAAEKLHVRQGERRG